MMATSAMVGPRWWNMGARQRETRPGGEESLAKAVYKDWCSSQGLQWERLCLGLQERE